MAEIFVKVYQGGTDSGPQGDRGYQGYQGAGGTGPQGNQGAQGGTGGGLTMRGLWVGGTNYVANDGVFDFDTGTSGPYSLFACKAPVSGSSTRPASDTSNWIKLSNAQGYQGNQGSAGAQGDDGAQGAAGAGVCSLWAGAGAMWPAATAGCAALAKTEMTTNDQTVPTIDFDASSVENAEFSILLNGWDGLTVTAQFVWTHATTTTNFDVMWGCKARSYANAEAYDAEWGVGQTVTDTAGTANTIYITSATPAITVGGTPASGELVHFRVYRVADNVADTLAVDAKLIGVSITYGKAT